MTKGELIDQMERLLAYTQGQTYNWDSDYGALVFATVARSGRTFEGICALLRAGLAVQAGMLTRSLFEDVVVGHWLVYNEADTEWIVEKFLRQREAIGLHQRKLHRETSGAMAVPLPIADDAEDRAQALIEEFGKEASGIGGIPVGKAEASAGRCRSERSSGSWRTQLPKGGCSIPALPVANSLFCGARNWSLISG